MNQLEQNNKQFSTLPLRAELLNNLATLDYVAMTPIQEKSLPFLLEGKDVIAKAKTGSGKTAAFGLSILNKLNVDRYAVQALVLCPTRELAEQVAQSLRKLARALPNVKILNLSGGLPMRPQQDSLRHGAHIIVGTPGRVQKHLEKESLTLNRLTMLVLDEADRMLDMGFIDDMRDIVKFCPRTRQTLLFSATYPTEIKDLAREFMQNPQEVIVEDTHTELDIEQRFYEVDHYSEKYAVLKALLLHHQPTSALIFCNTKQLTADLATQLKKDGFYALALHGDMEQVDRDQVIVRFTNQSCSILVATDVAARGLDIKDLPAVINYELSFEQDVHTHRIGRTGRAGSKGIAASITTPSDAQRICLIEEDLQRPVVWGKLSELKQSSAKIPQPAMVTIRLDSGKKDKIRPGDILGALTKDAALPGTAIGKIDISPIHSYVAIQYQYVNDALHYFQNGKMKGRKVNVRKLC